MQIGGVAAKLASLATEGADLIDALYAALPEKYRSRDKDYEQAVDAYWAARDSIENRIEDLQERDEFDYENPWAARTDAQIARDRKLENQLRQELGEFDYENPYPQQNKRAQHKMADLYKHWDKVDIPQALYNVIYEQIEDYAYGKLGQLSKAGKTNAADAGYDVGAAGYQSGSRYRDSLLQHARDEYVTRSKPEKTLSDYLPEFDYRDVRAGRAGKRIDQAWQNAVREVREPWSFLKR